ncbi:Glycosyltransferase [Granulibacter bethesdensis]|uniref:glycosyltransferase n=1 Tax=Granulibacter bethesdensis TaxID=364410 RepID=UPI00090BA938|nr:glycosyltransferase [Granulibacter bethesdensis]APH55980.1 Glycosyltransferase [Granulibacter bethesdensis]
MKFLFVHQNFPGQFLHIVRSLAEENRHEIIFLTEENPNFLGGVRKMVYRMLRQPEPNVHLHARDMELAAVRAEAVASAARNLLLLGFRPDIIIGHHGWGELLNLQDIWPGVPLLGYFEFFYRTYGTDVNFDPEFPSGPDFLPNVRNKNVVNFLALQLEGMGQTPTRFQLETYPEWARERIRVVPEGADLDACTPDPAIRKQPYQLGDFHVAPDEKLITFVSRDLEPYRGYHVMVRALPKILEARPDVKAILVGRDGVSYGARPVNTTWKEHFLNEQAGRLDMSRVCLPGRIDYEEFLKLLQRSNAHVYLTYPFVLSWSLREALATGCAIIGSDTAPVLEFLTHEENALITPCLDPDKLADSVLRLLSDEKLEKKLRRNARRYAEKHLRMEDHLASFRALISEMTGQEL